METVSRLELLKLALESSKGDPAQALALAREMASFIEGDKIAPAVLTASKAERLALPAPVRGRGRPKKAKPEVTTEVVVDRKAKRWTDADRTFAEQLFDSGVKVPEIARRVGRTANGVRQALHVGVLKPKTYLVNTNISEARKLAHMERVTRPDAPLANGLHRDKGKST